MWILRIGIQKDRNFVSIGIYKGRDFCEHRDLQNKDRDFVSIGFVSIGICKDREFVSIGFRRIEIFVSIGTCKLMDFLRRGT